MGENFDKLDKAKQLEIIFRYTREIQMSDSIENTLISLAGMGRDIVGAERCTIWLIDEENKNLYTKVAHGVDLLVIDINKGVVGECIKTQKPLIINEPYCYDKFLPEVDIKTGFITRSILAQPLFNSRGQIIGAIQALNKKSESCSFNEEDLNLFAVASSFTSSTVENFLLKKEAIESQNETITLLGEICEKRSYETGSHTARVSLYSKIIAEELGMPLDDIALVSQAAALHDIGKLAIPDRVLLKPGKLTKDEFREMQEHSEVGFKMLGDSKKKLLQVAAIIARQHHEKYNGKGYPFGLKGEEINIFARIVAVSDVFDAVTSKRCYKNAWNIEEAFNLVHEERGEHFDPKIVDAFFAGKAKIEEIYYNYREE